MFSSLTQDFSSGLASDSSNVVDVSQSFQTSHRSFSHVAGVVGTQGLCSYVLYSGCLYYGTNRAACDNSGTGGCGSHQHSACSVRAYYLVGNGCALEGYLDKVLLGVCYSFSYCVGNFSRLSDTESDSSVLVAYYNQRGKLHYASALNSLGYAVNGYDGIGKFH